MKKISMISIPYFLLLTLCVIFTNYVGQVALLIILAVYLLYFLRNNIRYDTIPLNQKLLSMLIMILAVSETIFGQSGIQGVVRFIQLFIIILIIYSAEIISEMEEIEIRNMLYIIAKIYLILFIIYELRERRLMGFKAFLSNPNKFGQLSLDLLVICLIVKDKKKRMIKYPILILLFFIIISGSRSAILATIFLFISLFILRINKNNGIIEKLKGIGLFWLTIIIVGFITIVYPSLYRTKLGYILTDFSRMYTHKNFFSQRQIIWSYIIEAIKEKPFFGYGLGTTPVMFIDDLRSSHNFYLQFTLQMGLVGLSLFILFLYQLYKRLLSNTDYLSAVARSFIIGMMFHECFEVSITENNWPCGFFMWLVIALAIGKNKRSSYIPSIEKEDNVYSKTYKSNKMLTERNI